MGKLVRQDAVIFKSEEPDFNYKAAQETFDLVMKMDPDEAQMFAHFVVSEVLEDTIEKNLKTLQRRVNSIVAKRIDDLRKVVEKAAAISKSEDSIEYLDALLQWEEISKANPYDHGYRFRETDFNRDPGTGQFRTKIKHTTKKPMYSDKQAKELGLPKHKGLSAADKAQFQEEYHQLATFLGNVHGASQEPGSNRVILQLQDKKTHERYDVLASVGTNPNEAAQRYNPKESKLVGVVARPGTLTVGGATFGLQRALGSNPTGGAGRGMDAVDQNFPQFADEFVKPGDKYNSNARTYNRIHAGSQLLGSVGAATQNPHIATAAALGQFVGSHGAEAEAVFGPPTRKMAYRYRGTERTPDKNLVAEYGRAVNQAKLQSVTNYADQGRGDRNADKKGLTQDSMVQMASRRVAAERRPPTKDELAAGRAVLVNYLSPLNREKRPYTPDKKLLNLHLAAGNTPPSEGILLNKEGQIVAQAVGYGDDHYLPFNLKNLKPLKGGEYIRTRSVGGLSSEDIYTGLMAGASKVTVVSRSGVFTVDFAEDFRGGRRHNDKAKRMVRRYEQILDAVQSEQVESAPVPPEVRQALTQQVKAEYSGTGVSGAQMRDLLEEKIKEYQMDPDISAPESPLENLIIHNGEAAGRDAAAYRGQVRALLEENRERTWKLNAKGYEAAQRVLQEQFPYYIAAHAIPLREDEADQKTDPGYVKPGRNRPTKARAGLYLGDKEGQGEKFSAEEADFQGVRNQKKTGSLHAIPRPGGARGGASSGGSSTDGSETPASDARQAQDDAQKKVLEDNRKTAMLATSATKLWESIKAIPTEGQQGPLADTVREYQNMDEGEFVSRFRADPKRFHDHAVQINAVPGISSELKSRFAEYNRVTGRSTAAEYDPMKARIPGASFNFEKEGKAFTSIGNKADREMAMQKIDRGVGKGVTSNRFPSMMDKDDIEKEITFLTEFASLTTGISGAVGIAARKDISNNLGIASDNQQLTALYNDPSKVDKLLEGMHKAKALRELGHDPVKVKQDPNTKGTIAASTPQETPEWLPPIEPEKKEKPAAAPKVEGGKLKPKEKPAATPNGGLDAAAVGAQNALEVLTAYADATPDPGEAARYKEAHAKLKRATEELFRAPDPETALDRYQSALRYANRVTKAHELGDEIPVLDNGDWGYVNKPK